MSAGTDLEPLNVGGGTFTDLRTDVENGENFIKIHYCYTNGDDGTIGIITSNIVINGDGAVIDMLESDIWAFHVSDSSVTFKIWQL